MTIEQTSANTATTVNRYSFLIETYSTERQKILGAWAMFNDDQMPWRPHLRARSVHEQMVHQCVSEDYWMKNFLGIDLGEPALPALETRLEFMKKYAASSAARMARLEILPESRFEDSVNAQICSSGRSPELAIPETGDKVIVYQAGRLHVGVTNS